MTDTTEPTTRLLVNNSTSVAGRAWRAGQTYDVPDTEIDALRPHIAAGIFSLVGEPDDAFAGDDSTDDDEGGDPPIPDFIAGTDDTARDPGQAGVFQSEADRRGPDGDAD